MAEHQTRLLDERTDADLVRSARQGDREAFEVLYFRYLSTFEGPLRRRVHLSASEAKSLYGNCLVRCVNGFDTSRPDSSFLRYLSRALRNSAASEHRSRRRWLDRVRATPDNRDASEPESTDVSPEELATDECAVVLRALDQLTFVQRRLIMRLSVDGASIDEVAEELGITRKQVDNGYQQAKRELGRLLPPEMWHGRSHRRTRNDGT